MFARCSRTASLLAATGLAGLLALTGCATAPQKTPSHSPSTTTSAAIAPTTPAPSSPRTTSTHARRAPEARTYESEVPMLPSTASSPAGGGSLPLDYSTGSATQVITVTAPAKSDTQATLQTWTRSGSKWVKVDAPVHAWVGSDGLTNSMSEFVSATPMGSFTLTQAFGRLSDPGTALPYFKTTPADWWISQAGPVYNTHQRCTNSSDDCGYKAPSEHLYYETPYYNYAVVIDYNTRNTGHVVQNGGSAVFLHVTVGEPTAGCVAIPQDQVVRILKWLKPADHPRILIGVA